MPRVTRKAKLAACETRCEKDANCKFIVHWSDDGCQIFASCTKGTHPWGDDLTSTIYQKSTKGATKGATKGSTKGVFGSSAQLKAAYKEWFAHEATAEETFGAISSWDTSQVDNLSGLFYDKDKFNEALVWDTSSVTNMAGTRHPEG